jgi:hypothetical protein
MAFSKSVIIRTFFRLIFGTIIFALMVGLILMPVLFSLINLPPIKSVLVVDSGVSPSPTHKQQKEEAVPQQKDPENGV